jgi:hypothetical protein
VKVSREPARANGGMVYVRTWKGETMTERRLTRWFIIAVTATVAAVISYAVSFSIAFDRSDVGQDSGAAGAIVWPAALISVAGLIAGIALLAVWLARRGSRAVTA